MAKVEVTIMISGSSDDPALLERRLQTMDWCSIHEIDQGGEHEESIFDGGANLVEVVVDG